MLLKPVRLTTMLSAALLATFTLTLPGPAQNLTTVLQQAVCAQQWGTAIKIIDQQLSAIPKPSKQRSELLQYRNRLQSLLQSGAKVPEWSKNCSTRPQPVASKPTALASQPIAIQPAASAIAPPQGTTSPPSSNPSVGEPARSADVFVDSIGVATHWNYPNTPYGYAYKAVQDKLVESGIRHVRDGLSDRIQALGALGIKSTVVADIDNNSNGDIATVQRIKDQIKAANSSGFIDAVEGPNEPDLFWMNFQKSYKGQGYQQGQAGISQGVIAFQQDLYTTLKSDPATAGLTVIGPALGVTYDPGAGMVNILGKGSLTNYVDWGNFHPYPGAGNPFSFPFPYGTIQKYYWQGSFPSVNLDEFPSSLDIYAPPFASKPMSATETGYATHAAGISETVHAKYIPRLLCEYFRLGIQRTYLYELIDEFADPQKTDPEANFGLLRHDVTPKPAYTALKSLIGLLQEKGIGATFKPSSLDYTLTVGAMPGYDRTQYVHHLLLQKSNKDFYLVLWHEVANEDVSVTPHRQIAPPDMPATLTLRQPMQQAILYNYDAAWQLQPTAVAIANNTIQLNVPDKVIVLKLTPAQ